jgi:hypothetical protein
MSDEEEDEDELEELDKVLKSLHDMLYQLKYLSCQFGGKLTKRRRRVHLNCLFATYIAL